MFHIDGFSCKKENQVIIIQRKTFFAYKVLPLFLFLDHSRQWWNNLGYCPTVEFSSAHNYHTKGPSTSADLRQSLFSGLKIFLFFTSKLGHFIRSMYLAVQVFWPQLHHTLFTFCEDQCLLSLWLLLLLLLLLILLLFNSSLWWQIGHPSSVCKFCWKLEIKWWLCINFNLLNFQLVFDSCFAA